MKSTRPIPPASIFLALLFAAPWAFADPAEEAVKEIRARYNTIEGKKLRSSKIEFEGVDEGVFSTLTRYYEGSELVKAHLFYGIGDHGATDVYFYYGGGDLFFVFASDSAWTFTGATLPNGESETIDTITEHRLYLVGGRLVRHLTKEAKSKVPSQLKGLIAKAPNHPGQDTERAKMFVTFGQRAYKATTPAGLGALFEE